ncbi:MAG: LPS export ABC transporter periplasmic protein LptC [Elusimicrobia bacterium]|nr:LPS export ABC transporter periplasmic protein LptC [Elusimicrobiota bacterium]
MRRAVPAVLALLLGACVKASEAPALTASQEAKGFTLRRSRAGAVEWKLDSPRAVFEEGQAKARLESPEIELFKKGKTETKARSEKGEIDLNTQDTLLSGDVRVENAQEKISLKTDLLQYIASAKEFRTDRPVEIRRPEGVMRGRGMTANHDLTEIHVKHQETRVE